MRRGGGGGVGNGKPIRRILLLLLLLLLRPTLDAATAVSSSPIASVPSHGERAVTWIQAPTRVSVVSRKLSILSDRPTSISLICSPMGFIMPGVSLMVVFDKVVRY